MNHKREVTGATAAPTPTDDEYSTAYPGGGASENHGGRKPIFSTSSIGQTVREPSDGPKTRRILSRRR